VDNLKNIMNIFFTKLTGVVVRSKRRNRCRFV